MKKYNKKNISKAKSFHDILKREAKPDKNLLRAVATMALNMLPEASVLGTELFSAIWRQSVMATVEPVCFRKKTGHVEVFLARRKLGESYPSCLHVCGTPIRSSDKKSINFVVSRLAKNEYGIMSKDLKLLSKQPIEVRIVEEERGPVLSLAFVATLSFQPPIDSGEWYLWADAKKYNNKEIVPYHRDWLIPTALKFWEKEI